MKSIRDMIIYLLGGVSKKEHKLVVDHFDNQIQFKEEFQNSLLEELKRAEALNLALTDCIHNFGRGKIITIDNTTTERICKVAQFFRMFTIYNTDKVVLREINETLFEELMNFIMVDFHEVLRMVSFDDGTFKRFNELVAKLNKIHPDLEWVGNFIIKR